MTRDRGASVGNATLTASDIARLANVGRAAVSNWRRRYADFPAPVGGTTTSPSFDAIEVEQWLHRQGRLREAGIEQVAWRHIERYQPATEIGNVLGICGAYLLVRSTQSTQRGNALLTPKQLVARLRKFDRCLVDMVRDTLPDEWTPQLATALRTIEQLSRERDPAEAFEYLHNQYVTSAQSMSGLAATPDTVAEVMLTLAGTGAHTFDFTSGTGSLLRMAADRALRHGTTTRCYAQEIRQQYALITLLRLWFIHLRAQASGAPTTPPSVHVGDSLLADAFPDLRADVVVANFPFGIHDWGHERLVYDPRWTYGLPPRTEPELAWVQHALAHLSPGGTAVVLMPPAAAARHAGRRIRAELVRRGTLRAVVALPTGLMQPTGLGLHVWVLSPTEQPPTRGLLLVDTSWTTHEALSEVVAAAWHSYLATQDGSPASGQGSALPGHCRIIAAIDVLDDQVDLTPQRYLSQTAELAADPAQTIARVEAFGQLLAEVSSSLPTVRTVEPAALNRAPHTSLADLIRAGHMSIHRTAARTTDDNPPPQIQADDILVPVSGSEIAARVATPEQVGTRPEPNTQLIRVDPARFDPWFIAGVLSSSENFRNAGRTSRTSNGTVRIDIRRTSIPVLPLNQQHAYGRAFRQLAEFRKRLHMLTAAGAALAQEISNGLTHGTLRGSS